MSGYLIAWARAHAPAPGAGYLVVVDRGGAITARAIAAEADAVAYADDVVSEVAPPDTIAVVLDGALAVRHRGRHYAARR